jgi:hypothetical protein
MTILLWLLMMMMMMMMMMVLLVRERVIYELGLEDKRCGALRAFVDFSGRSMHAHMHEKRVGTVEKLIADWTGK